MAHNKSIDTITVKNVKIHFLTLAFGIISVFIFVGALFAMIDFISKLEIQYLLHILVLAYVAYSVFQFAFEYLWQGIGDEVIRFRSNEVILGRSVLGYFKKTEKIKIDQLEMIGIRKFEPNTISGFKNAMKILSPASGYYLEFKLKNQETCGLWKNISSETKECEIINDIESNLRRAR
jgi:hypothetical protein